MPDDGNRYEAIDGVLYVTPGPTTRHQRVSMNLTIALNRILVEPGHGILFYAPLGVEFVETEEGVQPDLFFIRSEREHIIHDDTIQGGPDLVIEILSPSTARRDRTIKLDFYRRLGVAEYWVVDADAEVVEVWRLDEGATIGEDHRGTVPVRLTGQVAGHIELAAVFK